ncbi:hypothetical protein LCGC14_1028920 [marine sediment metagenome]|uniref:Uncharacterized protein n=1 Tax=marine sediment metagenome TaxID=412755 RepID=A0A0F9R105_9ZZZZ
MKKLILIILVILIIPIVIAIDNCKGTMFQQDIPCLLLLPVNQSVNPCNTLTTEVYNNGSTLLYTQTMAIYSPFKCNNTFNQTTFGTYTFQYGTGDTGSIVVEEDRFQQYYLYIAAFIVLLTLVGLGFWKHEGIFIMIAGILAMIIAINIFVNGFPNLTNEFLRNGMTLIVWGIGAYLIMLPGMEFFENWGND